MTTADSTVHVKKDSLGRIIEKWGNEKEIDNDINFRYFFFYNENDLLISEKRYFFDDDNTECIILDTAEYDELRYTCKHEENKYIIEKEECHAPEYNDSSKFIGRKLYYIYDHSNEKFIYHSQLSLQ